jgi:prepilin signal peptidase PulO-like enzyme (type II secretory pathway)
VFLAHPTPVAFAFWFVVWMTLLFVVMYDTKHKVIPWSCSGLLALLAFGSLFFNFSSLQLQTPTMWALLAGPLAALPLFLLSLVSGGRWMGWGDSALELSLGWFLGISAGFTALMLGFWIGAGIGILLLLYQRLPWHTKGSRLTMNSELPFAPFLILGVALAHFLHVDFFSTISLF